jgi:hypothetical protein
MKMGAGQAYRIRNSLALGVRGERRRLPARCRRGGSPDGVCGCEQWQSQWEPRGRCSQAYLRQVTWCWWEAAEDSRVVLYRGRWSPGDQSTRVSVVGSGAVQSCRAACSPIIEVVASSASSASSVTAWQLPRMFQGHVKPRQARPASVLRGRWGWLRLNSPATQPTASSVPRYDLLFLQARPRPPPCSVLLT